MAKFEFPACYNNLVIAALEFAKAHGLWAGEPDEDFILGCIDDVLNEVYYPLSEIDKDATIIVEEE